MDEQRARKAKTIKHPLWILLINSSAIIASLLIYNICIHLRVSLRIATLTRLLLMFFIFYLGYSRIILIKRLRHDRQAYSFLKAETLMLNRILQAIGAAMIAKLVAEPFIAKAFMVSQFIKFVGFVPLIGDFFYGPAINYTILMLRSKKRVGREDWETGFVAIIPPSKKEKAYYPKQAPKYTYKPPDLSDIDIKRKAEPKTISNIELQSIWEQTKRGHGSTGGFPSGLNPSDTVLIFDTEEEIFKRLKHLTPNQKVIHISQGNLFRVLDQEHYQIDPTKLADYRKLFNLFEQKKIVPTIILHLWSLQSCFKKYHETLSQSSNHSGGTPQVEFSMDFSFLSLNWALIEKNFPSKIRLTYFYPSGDKHPTSAPHGENDPNTLAFETKSKVYRMEALGLLCSTVGLYGPTIAPKAVFERWLKEIE